MPGPTRGVWRFLLGRILIVCSVLLTISLRAQAVEFSEEKEKDFPLRSIGHLQITNPKGDTTVVGWSLDKVRVRIKKKVIAETKEEARRLLDKMSYRYHV